MKEYKKYLGVRPTGNPEKRHGYEIYGKITNDSYWGGTGWDCNANLGREDMNYHWIRIEKAARGGIT